MVSAHSWYRRTLGIGRHLYLRQPNPCLSVNNNTKEGKKGESGRPKAETRNPFGPLVLLALLSSLSR